MSNKLTLYFYLILTLCLTGSISMGENIVFDANSSNSTNSSWTLNWTHTIGGGENRILIVGLGAEDDRDTDLVVWSIKYNNVNMNPLLGSSITEGTDFKMKTEIYYLLESDLPPSGSYTIAVMYSGEITRICGGGISLANVAQEPAEAVDTNSTTWGNNVSTDITTQTDGAWVVDIAGSGDPGTFTPTGIDMVEQFDVASSGSSAAGSTRLVSSAGQVTMSWYNNSLSRMTHSVAAFSPVNLEKATNPAPMHLDTDVVPDVQISWVAGQDADSHDIYFGKDFDDVNAADNTWPVGISVYKGNQAIDANTYDPVGLLESEQTYYWRIDEVNETDPNISRGNIWNFTIEQYIPGDFTDDGVINNADIGMLSDQWLDSGPEVTADADFDDKVNFNDFAIVANDWVPIFPDECDDWQTLHPEWIFCDDFEVESTFVRTGRYFEYDSDGGDFIPVEGVGLDESIGMRVIFQAGEQTAGGFKLAFGRNPNSYMDKGIRDNEDFRDVYYRMYLKMQDGWVGSPAKLSRATCFSSSTDWSQAMIAHLWSSGDYLLVDPVRCVDLATSLVKCIGYNDFPNMDWIGNMAGVTPIFDSVHDGIWYCVESHVKLNDPGTSNGVQEFWIDGNLEARRDYLNFVVSYTDYAINAALFENYWNSGSPQLQERYFDNIVVSTQPIGPWDP